MRRALAILVAVVLATSVSPGLGAAPAPGGDARPDHLVRRRLPNRWPGTIAGHRILVRFRRSVPAARSRSLVSALGGRVTGHIGLVGAHVVQVPRGRSIDQALARLEASPLVAEAEPDRLVFAAAPPSDDRFAEQWGLRNTGQAHPVAAGGEARGRPGADISALGAWEGVSGGGQPIIAVVDSGVDVGHPDLAGSIWTNVAERDGMPGVDDDHNGYKNDVHGFDFARNRAKLIEDVHHVGWSHGTHVAGIAAADRDNQRTIGVCPECRIMVLKFMRPYDTNGNGQSDTMVGSLSAELEALHYAKKMGAKVVNASFGSIVWSSMERRAFAALGRAGILSVVAAGNENGDNDMYLFLDFDKDGIPDSVSPAYPASYNLPSILSVAATNDQDRYGYSTACRRFRNSPRWPCTFTSWGRNSVDVAAPGVDILSTVPNSNYSTFDGTSMAAPHVAGLAGLLWRRNPSLSATRVRNKIMNSVDRPATMDKLYAIPGRSPRRGGFTRTNGRINARKALTASATNRFRRTDGDVVGARKLSRAKRGSVAWPADVNDVYRKRLKRGRSYSVVLNGPHRKNIDLFVYKPGTKEVWQIERGCITGRSRCQLRALGTSPRGDERVGFKARRGGVYFFQVSSFFTTARYSLRVRIAAR